MSKHKRNGFQRRTFLKGALAVGGGAALAGQAGLLRRLARAADEPGRTSTSRASASTSRR